VTARGFGLRAQRAVPQPSRLSSSARPRRVRHLLDGSRSRVPALLPVPCRPWRLRRATGRGCRPDRSGRETPAVLWRFLGQHEPHIAEAAGVPGFDIVTTVPGTRIRDKDHPLVHLVGTLVGQTRDRYQPVLALGPGASVEGRSVLVNRYRATKAMADHPAVLLVDDTWTTGGRAQSAAIALHHAGAGPVAVVVLGRHFDRNYGSGETYYQQAKARKFTWDTCCLELRGPLPDAPAVLRPGPDERSGQ
jgi:hypothetical protein